MESATVRWEELLPREFHTRKSEASLVYLPLGLCEPHGHAAPFGLDTIKAVWLCEESARRTGGIVAPTQGYHIHETGYHRPWLAEVVGDRNPHLGSVPPDVLLRMLLFQLRAFINAGFNRIVVLTGHHGNQSDLRIVAQEVMDSRPVQIIAVSDPELVLGAYEADHAGRYELSQLLHIRPDLVDLGRLDDVATSPMGRFAQGEDGSQASAELGAAILEQSLAKLQCLIAGTEAHGASVTPLAIAETNEIWQRIVARQDDWCTLSERHPDLVDEEYPS
jgi:creatinine amidohydrolase